MIKRSYQEEQKAIRNVCRMFSAQEKEITPTMLQFSNDEHVIKIISEAKGFITCTVRHRERNTPGVDHTITFLKKNREGVVWTFMRADRMSFLAFEHDHPGVINS